MNRAPLAWLRHDVIAEPLINHWYAWSYLIPPASAARYMTHAQIEVMASFVDAPQVHVAALRDPAMMGGPFIQYGPERVPEMRALLDHTRSDQAPLLALSAAIDRLERLLAAHPAGRTLDDLYAQVPDELRGFVELVYDGRNHPSVRYHEGLLYRSAFYRPDNQGIALRRVDDSDRRAFVMSTPRLASDIDVFVRRPFADPALDLLFAARHTAAPVNELADLLDLNADQRVRFAQLFTSEPPRSAARYAGPDVRVRYMGHACVLIETASTVILVDPLVSYEHPQGMERFSYNDLPAHIDYALITHNHQDHVMLETLLQLRHRIGQVVVPSGHRGVLLDPSLRLMLAQIGFPQVREIDRLDSLRFDGGDIVSLPVLGEHGDLDIASKTAWWIEAHGRTVLCAADSNNLDGELYTHVKQLFGPLDMLFIGMECEGAPYTWAYGPLLPAPVPHQQAQARRLNGSDAARGARLIERLAPSEVYVYAMGQEPWLNYITSIHYTDESMAIVESDKLVAHCRAAGLPSRRLLGRAEFELKAGASRRPAATPLPARISAAVPMDAPAVATPAQPIEVTTRVVNAPAVAPVDELSTLLDELHSLNIQLAVDGGALKVNAPKGALTPALTARVKTHKPALIALLAAGAPARTPSPTPAGDAVPALPDDARLPDDVRPPAVAAQTPPRNILLTGATGFVGAFLLRELLLQTDADIHCLLRFDASRGSEAGMARLCDALSGYGLWQDAFARRLHPVAGDLAHPHFGLEPAVWQALAEGIDVIHHTGAHVHHMLPYEQLRAPNVLGTVEALRLACTGRAKPLHYMSSLSVLPPLALAAGARFMERDALDPARVPAGGYNRTKWIAEQLVREAGARGLPVSIYRPGPVSGDSASGAFNVNDFLYRLMQGYLQSGCAPVGEMPLDLLPVDYVARAVAHLSRQPAAAGMTFHLLHPHPASSDLLFDACKRAGHMLRRVPYAEWYAELQRIAREDRTHALYPLVALFSSRQGADGSAPVRSEHVLPYDTTQTQTLLGNAHFGLPALDAALFDTYMRAMARAGSLPTAQVEA